MTTRTQPWSHVSILASLALGAIACAGDATADRPVDSARQPAPPERAAPSEPRVTVAPDSIARDGSLRVRAAGFAPAAPVVVGFGPPQSEYEVIQQGTTDAQGALDATVRVPSWAQPGRAYVLVVAADSHRVKAVSDPVRVHR